MVNVELLQKTLDTIKANPQHWEQSNWHCDTSHCFAGFAELIARKVPITTDAYALMKDAGFFNYEDDSWNTSQNATNLLGITEGDANELFCGYNTLEELERMVAHLIEHGSLKTYGLDYSCAEDDD